MTIDSHHHFWSYSPEQYPWLGERMRTLRRDFLPEHLAAEIKAAGIDGVVSVQARQTVEETAWLLDLAAKNDFIKGVVGWVPLVSANVREDLEPFARSAKLKAVRHVLQDEPDDGLMLSPEFNRGVAALHEFGLRYDLLIYERHLPGAVRFVDKHPKQTFILDHLAKPRIRDGAMSPWRENLAELARRPNVTCKVSGMATEADWAAWTPAQLKPYFDAALEAFGPSRLMFGSDWPVCLAAVGYARWADTVREWAKPLSETERARLMGGTAAEAYGL
jgi:L-fuconolactonase